MSTTTTTQQKNALSEWVAHHVQKVLGCECAGYHERQQDLGRYLTRGNKTQVIIEEKVDGTRVFCFRDLSKESYLVTKHNGVYRGEIVLREVERFLPYNTILDCEFVRRTGELYVFDVLMSNGEDMRHKSQSDRKEHLLQMFKGFYEPAYKLQSFTPVQKLHVVLGSSRLGADGSLMQQVMNDYDQAVKDGYEGVIVKDPNARYEDPRAWLKLKRDDTVDCFVWDVETRPETGAKVYKLGVYDSLAKVIHLADCYSAIKSVDKSRIGVNTVLEVRYQPTEGFKHLRHPTVMRIRTDKTKEECLINQVPWAKG